MTIAELHLDHLDIIVTKKHLDERDLRTATTSTVSGGYC
jgi:hypothetical protein